MTETRDEELTARSESFRTRVEDIRTWYGSGSGILPRLEDRILRQLGLAPMSAGTAAVLGGVLGVGIRLILALLATALTGQWAGIPWPRWAVVLVLYGVMDATAPLVSPPPDVSPRPWVRRIVEDWTALLPTIVRESDLQDLARFIRRLYRVSIGAVVGVAVAAIMLAACWLFAPSAMSDLPAGSFVLLVLLLYDFGETPIYWGNLVNWALMAREARYDHHLFWPSPADSPEVHKATRKTSNQGFAAGAWITVFLVLAVVLVGWDSPLVLPLAVGFIVIGYLTTIGFAFSNRGSIQKIVERIRDRQLAALQHRIDGFEPRFTELSPQESEQLRDLLFLHDKIRDAPTTPTTTHTLIRTAVGLIVPTIIFMITVFGEVYAERVLDSILP